MNRIIFNKDQREGLVKVSDNVATASVLAALLGGFVEEKITIIGVLILIVLSVVFLMVSYILRKGEENGY